MVIVCKEGLPATASYLPTYLPLPQLLFHCHPPLFFFLSIFHFVIWTSWAYFSSSPMTSKGAPSGQWTTPVNLHSMPPSAYRMYDWAIENRVFTNISIYIVPVQILYTHSYH